MRCEGHGIPRGRACRAGRARRLRRRRRCVVGVVRAQGRRRRALRRHRVRDIRHVDRERREDERRDRSLPRRSEHKPPEERAPGLADGARRLHRERAVSLLRRPDRRPEDRTRGPDQRVADGRGVHRLRPRRRARRDHQRPQGAPDDHRGRHRREQREGRRDEHLVRLARDRVSALGPGPFGERPRHTARERLHDGQERRPPRARTCGSRRSACATTCAASAPRGRPAASTARRSSTIPMAR